MKGIQWKLNKFFSWNNFTKKGTVKTIWTAFLDDLFLDGKGSLSLSFGVLKNQEIGGIRRANI